LPAGWLACGRPQRRSTGFSWVSFCWPSRPAFFWMPTGRCAIMACSARKKPRRPSLLRRRLA